MKMTQPILRQRSSQGLHKPRSSPEQEAVNHKFDFNNKMEIKEIINHEGEPKEMEI